MNTTSSATTDETAVQETDAEPPPEPWTPERVSEWNAYYDVYVKLAALLLVFMVSCNYVSDPQFWLHLKTGQLIAEQRSPIKTDVFSYTENGRPWIDIHWLFQWANAAIYKLVIELVPVNPADPTANRASAEQIAVGSLLVVSALMRLATAWLLLKIRRPGPGLWWSAIVVTLCLGAVFNPMHGLIMGGLAGVATVIAANLGTDAFRIRDVPPLSGVFPWAAAGTLALGPDLRALGEYRPVFLHRACWCSPRRASAACSTARPIRPRSAPPEKSGKEPAIRPATRDPNQDRPPAASVFVILAVCALACLVNPFTYQAYVDALFPYLQLFQPPTKITTFDLLSFFGPWVRKQCRARLVLASGFLSSPSCSSGSASFFLNIRRFSWARFLPFAVMSVIWGIFM